MIRLMVRLVIRFVIGLMIGLVVGFAVRLVFRSQTINAIADGYAAVLRSSQRHEHSESNSLEDHPLLSLVCCCPSFFSWLL